MNTALSPVVAGPLVDRHEHVRRITAAWQKTVDNIVETGRLLIGAKDDIGFQEMIRAELPFSTGTAQRLMRVAEDRVLSNAAHAPHLPASWGTLYELAKLHKGGLDLETLIEEGAIHPKMERRDVLALLPEQRDDDLLPDYEGSAKPEDEAGETTEVSDAAEVPSEKVSRFAYKLIQLDIALARDLGNILWHGGDGQLDQLARDLGIGIEIEEGRHQERRAAEATDPSLDASFETAVAAAVEQPQPKKRGRPPGSKNKPKPEAAAVIQPTWEAVAPAAEAPDALTDRMHEVESTADDFGIPEFLRRT
jgi:hypothetical protein